MMKKLSIVALVTIGLVACNNTHTTQNNPTENTTMSEVIAPIGGQNDAHGCLTSAGQSWSELLQECVQVFEVGTRLNPLQVKEGEAVISAFIVTKAGDDNQVELFITAEKTNPLLKQEKDGTYKSDKYLYNPKTQKLYIDGKVAYKAEMPKI